MVTNKEDEKMKYIVIGGSNGLGLAISVKLINRGHNVLILDVVKPKIKLNNAAYKKINLFTDDVNEIRNDLADASGLIITAGIGRVCRFEEMSETEIDKLLKVNLLSISKIIHIAFPYLIQKNSFDCLVMTSIAGLVASPLFSIYAASKAGLYRMIESLNAELRESGTNNRICSVVATSIKNTSFAGGKTDVNALSTMASELLSSMMSKLENHIIDRELVNSILERYSADPTKFAQESIKYKIENNRLSNKSPIKIGYLSGTFDLFHIGHLNLLRRAKEHCDFLVVGVHKDASHKGKETFIPFEERCEILRHINYVDKVIESKPEDNDVWNSLHYDFLFVGSDYKGTDRFNRYEKFFEDKGVKIVYFPYTKRTSSSKLRRAIDKPSPSKN